MTSFACARIEAMHSVVFVGFSDDALSHASMPDILKLSSRSADLGKRGGKTMQVWPLSHRRGRTTARYYEDSLKGESWCWWKKTFIIINNDHHHHPHNLSALLLHQREAMHQSE
jgi:acyl-coenzyme A synthetase/AMP-(fatty) acid ligase